MRINSITIKEDLVVFSYTVNENSDGASKKSEECPEAPLPELSDKFKALPKIACSIMEWPAKYAVGMDVFKLALRYTKYGTRSVQFKLAKAVEMAAGKPPKITTPWVRIDKPQDGESGSVDLTESQVATIDEAIFEISRYISGERSQQLLNFDQAKAGLQAVADLGKLDLDGTGGN